MTKIPNVENSRWRTAAILKIVLSLYLNRKTSDFNEIWCVDADCAFKVGYLTKYQNFTNSKWRTAAILKIVFWPTAEWTRVPNRSGRQCGKSSMGRRSPQSEQDRKGVSPHGTKIVNSWPAADIWKAWLWKWHRLHRSIRGWYLWTSQSVLCWRIMVQNRCRQIRQPTIEGSAVQVRLANLIA